MTEHYRFLHTMNLFSNSNAPNINEHIATPIGSKFDPSAELTLATRSIFILGFGVNSL